MDSFRTNNVGCIIKKYDTLEIDVGAYKIVKKKLKLIEEKLTKIKDATIKLGR